MRAVSRLAEALRPILLRAPPIRSYEYVRAAPKGAPKAADTNSSSNGSTRLPELKLGEELPVAIVSATPYFTLVSPNDNTAAPYQQTHATLPSNSNPQAPALLSPSVEGL